MEQKRRVKILRVSFTLLMSLSLVSCSKTEYQLVEEKSGRTMRLNKNSGEVAEVTPGGLIPLIEKREKDNPTDSAFTKLRDWKPGKMEIGKDKALVVPIWKTACRDEKLYYKFAIFTHADLIAKDRQLPNNPIFTLEALDKDGFTLQQIPIEFRSMTTMQTEDSTAHMYTASGTLACDLKTYRSTDRWDVTWRGWGD
jgi:hypothetical protein